MEAFFEFIFGNLAFLIVVIGGIISFLKRANQNQNQKQPSKEKRVKPFIPQLEDLFEELNKPQVERKAEKTPVFTAAEQVPEAEQKVDLEAVSTEMMPNPYYEKLRQIENTKHHIHVDTGTIYAGKAAHTAINRNAMIKKKVIDGFIWGEILGPPRAKKKHSYSYLKR